MNTLELSSRHSLNPNRQVGNLKELMEIEED